MIYMLLLACVIRPTVIYNVITGMCYWTHCDIHVVGVCVIRPTVIYMLLGYVLLDPL